MSNSGFKEGPEENNVDLLDKFVTKSYLIDVYPYMTGMGNIQMAGLWGSGFNNNGQLGDNTTLNRSSPVQTIAGGTNWKSISSGGNHTLAIKTDGTLWGWGNDAYGQLGDNSTINRSSPVQTTCGGNNWKSVVCIGHATAMIKTDGTLWTCGRNFEGQLGDNTVTKKSSPVQTIAAGTNWKYVAAGNFHVIAVKTDGTLWGWGQDTYGQLGDDSISNKSSPVQTICGGNNWKFIATSSHSSHAIKNDGTLWSWGKDNYGQLGDNSTLDKSSPVQTIAGGTNWKSVYNNSSAIKTDGTLWRWGINNQGQIGDNSTIKKSSPVQTIAGGTNWKSVGTGNGYMIALKTDGTLWGCGLTLNGELFSYSASLTSSPILIAVGANWKSVYSGNGNSPFAICEMGDDF